MNETHASSENNYEPGLYEIRIKGHLDNRRAAWFEGLAVIREENGITLLTGQFDQAALHGLLRKVRDLGMPIGLGHSGLIQSKPIQIVPNRRRKP